MRKTTLVGCAVKNGRSAKNAIIWDTYQISRLLFGNPIYYMLASMVAVISPIANQQPTEANRATVAQRVKRILDSQDDGGKIQIPFSRFTQGDNTIPSDEHVQWIWWMFLRDLPLDEVSSGIKDLLIQTQKV
jgi:hypothetical protein